MLLIFGMGCLAAGTVLIAAAYLEFRRPGASPRLRRWIGGETACVMLTLLPAAGLVALLNLLIEKGAHAGWLDVAAAAAIAAAGYFATVTLIRRGARYESPMRGLGAAAATMKGGPDQTADPSEKQAA